MLILTRRVGESIIIGDNIKAHILGVNGNQVRVGVDAPRDVEVHREEVKKLIDDGWTQESRQKAITKTGVDPVNQYRPDRFKRPTLTRRGVREEDDQEYNR